MNPKYFKLLLHVKGTEGEWSYYDGEVWKVYYHTDEMSLI